MPNKVLFIEEIKKNSKHFATFFQGTKMTSLAKYLLTQTLTVTKCKNGHNVSIDVQTVMEFQNP